MTSAEEYINAAIKELKEPSVEGTNDLLGHGYEIDFENPRSRQATEGVWWNLVHFPLREKNFTIGVAMNCDGEGSSINIIGVSFIPRIRLYLGVISEQLSAEAISERLQLAPTRVEIMGQPKFGKVLNKTHGWFLDYQGIELIELDEGIVNFLPTLEKHAELLRSLSPECYIGLNAVIYDGPNRQLTNLHLTKEQMGILSKMGIEFDVDHYLGL